MKKLAPALVFLVLLVACGAALIWYAERSLKSAQSGLAAARNDRTQNREKLSKISEEEREVKEKLEVYRRLRDVHVLGEERRLEWADAVARIRKQRELADVRYLVEPQKLLVSLPGKPAGVDFFSSTMKLTMSLLHEGDLLSFLEDLRAAGNAYYVVQRCGMTRSGATGALTNLAPRVQAECTVDLVTIQDRGAKR
jgi:hypothetical protein